MMYSAPPVARPIGRDFLEIGRPVFNLSPSSPHLSQFLGTTATGSINFHKNNGFTECGRFKKVGKEKGQIFDTAWRCKRCSKDRQKGI